MSFNYETQVFDLPEDLQRAKMNGDFDALGELIDLRLRDARLTPMMRQRLETEKLCLDRWLRRYPYDRKAALELCKKRIKDFTEEEFDSLEKQGVMDFLYVKGEKRYLSSFCGTLIKMLPEIAARQLDKKPYVDDGASTDEFIKYVKQHGSAAYRYRIRSSLKIEDEAFESGETYTVHVPVPAASAQQKAGDITITADPDAMISKPDALLRAVCWKRTLEKNEPFVTEFSYTSRISYVDPMHDAPRVVYPDALPPCEDDLSEQLPHIVFTPYLKQLAHYIAGDEKRPLHIAKKIYDYITLNVRYSFMRTYILIDRHAEYCALNLKGDCGIQAILFITLCRILGVPARWQSGLTVDKFGTGSHDWAQFYTEEFGWLFADPSYGGGGTRQENEEKRLFYFGNVDPFRMVANRRYLSEFEVPKKFIRFDPCDSQEGEAESTKAGFDGFLFDKTDEVLAFERVE